MEPSTRLNAPAPPPPALADFRALYDLEFDYVARALRRLGVQERDVRDLCQDVFLVAYNRYSTFDRARRVRPWLFGIAFRVVSDFRHKAYHRRELGDAPLNELSSGSSVEDQVLQREARRTVLTALEALPPERRAVFILHDLDGCRAPEIAESLEVPVNTVYSRLRVARQEFAVAVKKLNPERGES